jgi:hypothetical protein
MNSHIRIVSNYDLILSCSNFRTLYSRRRYLDVLFLINVSKGKINCHSIMDTVLYSCVHIVGNDRCRFLEILAKELSPLRTLYRHQKVFKLIVLFCFIFACFLLFSVLYIYLFFCAGSVIGFYSC